MAITSADDGSLRFHIPFAFLRRPCHCIYRRVSQMDTFHYSRSRLQTMRSTSTKKKRKKQKKHKKIQLCSRGINTTPDYINTQNILISLKGLDENAQTHLAKWRMHIKEKCSIYVPTSHLAKMCFVPAAPVENVQDTKRISNEKKKTNHKGFSEAKNRAKKKSGKCKCVNKIGGSIG